MKKLFLLLVILICAFYSAGQGPRAFDNLFPTVLLGPKTIGSGTKQLPGAGYCDRCVTIVTDGSNTSDCTIGGGTSEVVCFSNGVTWAPLAGSSGQVSPSAPPTASNWTVYDAGGSNTTISDQPGAVMLVKASGNNVGEASILAPTPSGTAFTVTAHILQVCPSGTNVPSTALIVGAAGDGAFVAYESVADAGQMGLRVVQWASSGGANNVPHAFYATGITPTWFRVQYTGSGGNLVYSISPNGATGSFTYTFSSDVATGWIITNPVRIGFAVYPQLIANSCTAVLDYWKVTTP